MPAISLEGHKLHHYEHSTSVRILLLDQKVSCPPFLVEPDVAPIGVLVRVLVLGRRPEEWMVVTTVVDDEAATEQGFRNVSVFVDGSSGSVDGRHFRRLFASLKLTIQHPCRECWDQCSAERSPRSNPKFGNI